MVVPLFCALRAYSRLFQKIMGDVAADHLVLVVEMHFHELAETGTVVVASSFSVTECFQDWISCEKVSK